MADPTPPPAGITPPPSPADRDRRDLASRALAVALLVGLSVAGAFLLAPPMSERMPGPEALGTPASATIKADRDYDIVDEEATARRRAAAASAERPVYDLDEGAAEEAAARIRAAFGLMRAEAAPAEDGRPPDQGELQRRWAAQLDAFVARLQLLVRPEDLRGLSQVRFSEEAEGELAALAGRGLTGLVVGQRALLPAERDAALVVRSFRSGKLVGERIMVEPSSVRDVATAREEVARAAEARLAGLPPAARQAVAHLAAAAVGPTLTYNQAETERRRVEAASRVKPVVIPVKRGEKIVGDGERVEQRHLVVFDAIRAQQREGDRSLVRLGGGLLVALLVALLWRFGRRALPGTRPTRKDAVLLAALLLGGLVTATAGGAAADILGEHLPLLPRDALPYVLPLAAGALIARQVLTAEATLLVALATSLLAGLLAGESIPLALHALVTSLAAAGAPGRHRDRAGLFRAGAAAGVAGAALAAAVGLYGGRDAWEVVASALVAFVGGAAVLPVVVAGLLPVVEGLFGYVTDQKLLELANLNHPALKELIVQAPGTYHHSILMGSMVEPAAQAIGADPLRAKVGAYFHDLGKIRNPAFYAENQRGENRHDGLAPSMSALIVKRHVTDGLELARQWKLPRVVAEVIPEHHGTRLVGYFWAKHLKAGGPEAAADEALFRYPGPRPRSREAALVMLADACEASARALTDPTPEALQALVQKRVTEVFAEGQLDECELTLRDLTAVSAAMASALAAIYHTRPDYPGRAEGARPPIQLVGRP